MHIIGLKILGLIIMNKPQQLTFPWSKQNKFTFDDFFFDSPNEEVKLALKNNDDRFFVWS